MLTWSLGWASSPASSAITSFAFMFEEVPEPVWNTSIGNWSSCSPLATSSPAFAIRSARSVSSLPSSAFARAAAAFSLPSQWMTGAGIGWPEIWKFLTALDVSSPHSSVRVAIHSGYLPGLAAGGVAPSEGALKARRQRPAGLAEASGGVEPTHEVGVNGIGSLADRAEQVAELERSRARRVTPGLGVELGRRDDHLLADAGELARLLLRDEAVGDGCGPGQPNGSRSALERLQIRLVAGQAGRRGLVVLLVAAAADHEDGCGHHRDGDGLAHHVIVRPP